MPSFSLLKRSPRPSRSGSPEDASLKQVDGSISNGTTGRGRDGERRFSKRDLLQGLLDRTMGRIPRGGLGLEKAEGTISPPPGPASPKSPVNPNKPLPSPPPPDSEKANGPPPKPVLKLDRIMIALSEADVEKLFSGAPQYFARSEGHFTGAPHPSVAFPWDEALEIRDLTDHTQIEDQAWGCVTAWPHITRDVNRNPSAAVAASPVSGRTRRAHFYPRCRERPNMLSMQGLEKGTMGYQAALELAVSDALEDEQFGFDSMGEKAQAIVEQRQKLLTSKTGLRHLEEAVILERLIVCGERYKTYNVQRSMSAELYNELFLHVLHPPTRVIDHNDPYSLAVQIQALLKVLAAPNVWVDFSHVEWRIRLGQILWGSALGDELEDGVAIDEAATVAERQEERYWLLLQTLLACELLLRLDAITDGEELGAESIKPQEVHRFERDANASVKWSLHLARAWLENIDVTKAASSLEAEQAQHATGWLASLTGKMTLNHHHPHPHLRPEPQLGDAHSHHHHAANFTVKGRHGQRQVDGLTHFARKLRWPDIESYATRISENCRSATEATPLSSPIASPMSSVSRSSYFGGAKIGNDINQSPSRRRKMAAALHPSGWLSKSYVSGLMLPGEGLSHFLMSTLLENDKEAMGRLGPMANLCGGFVYCGKSFWSTACIVGRVLAAAGGSAECMGWISSDVTPLGLGDGWVNIEVDDIPEDVRNTGKQARLWGKTHIERESDVLGDADPSSVLPGDFIIPFENNYPRLPPVVRIQLKSLNLFAPVSSVHTTPTEEVLATPFSDATVGQEIMTYPASVAFTAQEVGDGDKSETEYNFALANDVYFVTAHPCAPSSHVKFIKSPTSPTIQQIDVSDSASIGKSSSPASITGHPLHKFYTYTVVHLTELLERKDSSLEDLLRNTSSVRRPSQTPAQDTKPRVLVIDCITGFAPQARLESTPSSPVLDRRPAGGENPAEAKMHLESRRRQFGSDMEVLVRAVCAEKGWNALISRRRRGCLACAIREASALSWKVIIRVD